MGNFNNYYDPKKINWVFGERKKMKRLVRPMKLNTGGQQQMMQPNFRYSLPVNNGQQRY
jgi:hypothetical protein